MGNFCTTENYTFNPKDNDMDTCSPSSTSTLPNNINNITESQLEEALALLAEDDSPPPPSPSSASSNLNMKHNKVSTATQAISTDHNMNTNSYINSNYKNTKHSTKRLTSNLINNSNNITTYNHRRRCGKFNKNKYSFGDELDLDWPSSDSETGQECHFQSQTLSTVSTMSIISKISKQHTARGLDCNVNNNQLQIQMQSEQQKEQKQGGRKGVVIPSAESMARMRVIHEKIMCNWKLSIVNGKCYDASLMYLHYTKYRYIFSNYIFDNGCNGLHIAVLNKSHKLAIFLLDTCKININSVNIYTGKTALHYACEENDVFIVKIFLRKYNGQANIPDRNGIYPIHIARAQHNIKIQQLLKQEQLPVSYKHGHCQLYDVRKPNFLQTPQLGLIRESASDKEDLLSDCDGDDDDDDGKSDDDNNVCTDTSTNINTPCDDDDDDNLNEMEEQEHEYDSDCESDSNQTQTETQNKQKIKRQKQRKKQETEERNCKYNLNITMNKNEEELRYEHNENEATSDCEITTPPLPSKIQTKSPATPKNRHCCNSDGAITFSGLQSPGTIREN